MTPEAVNKITGWFAVLRACIGETRSVHAVNEEEDHGARVRFRLSKKGHKKGHRKDEQEWSAVWEKARWGRQVNRGAGTEKSRASVEKGWGGSCKVDALGRDMASRGRGMALRDVAKGREKAK